MIAVIVTFELAVIVTDPIILVQATEETQHPTQSTNQHENTRQRFKRATVDPGKSFHISNNGSARSVVVRRVIVRRSQPPKRPKPTQLTNKISRS